jgi:hypothetical protein
VEGSCEHGNKCLGTIKCGEFLDLLRNLTFQGGFSPRGVDMQVTEKVFKTEITELRKIVV